MCNACCTGVLCICNARVMHAVLESCARVMHAVLESCACVMHAVLENCACVMHDLLEYCAVCTCNMVIQEQRYIILVYYTITYNKCSNINMHQRATRRRHCKTCALCV